MLLLNNPNVRFAWYILFSLFVGNVDAYLQRSCGEELVKRAAIPMISATSFAYELLSFLESLWRFFCFDFYIYMVGFFLSYFIIVLW
jgi:hypothetical protein